MIDTNESNIASNACEKCTYRKFCDTVGYPLAVLQGDDCPEFEPIEPVESNDARVEVAFLPFESTNQTRYLIANKTTGEVLDDANGYGFKSIDAAQRCWAYKIAHPDIEKNESIKSALEKSKGTVDYAAAFRAMRPGTQVSFDLD